MLLRSVMNSSHTPLKHEEEDDESSVDLSMFTKDDKFFIDLKMFDTEYSKSSDSNYCCHHIKKVSTSI
jgi:hypothetical protein